MAWARPFRLHLTDGRVWHGAQFPSGFVCVDRLGEPNGPCEIATTVDALLADRPPEHPLNGARVQWADEED